MKCNLPLCLSLAMFIFFVPLAALAISYPETATPATDGTNPPQDNADVVLPSSQPSIDRKSVV